jgi:hypothetical protein
MSALANSEVSNINQSALHINPKLGYVLLAASPPQLIKLVFTGATYRTYPIFRQLFKRRAGLNMTIGVSELRIINIPAN